MHYLVGKSVIEAENRHQFCPRTINGWCGWQSDKIAKKSTYKKKLSLLLSIKSLLAPVFQILSKNELLNKCLHGQTQNNNESLNNVIWKRCPKTVFVSKKVLEVSVFSAIIEFNEEVIGLESVYVELGIPYNFF